MALERVNFIKYCGRCRYRNLSPTTLPCDDCNEVCFNEDTDEPICFVQDKEDNKKGSCLFM